ncbi:hypothetical protein AAGR22_16110 [Erwinia sp. HDF1-3R]|uniref:hypothetical protein n=1 Tax=Erwinia sp. HDF1-3R TaxID=3141543 RepID=UPI0031F52E24
MSAINEFHENDISKRLEERKRKLQLSSDNKNKSDEPILQAPTIEGILADGTIPVEFFQQSVELLVPAWGRVREGDMVHVFLNDNNTSFITTYIVDEPEEVDFPLKLQLPQRFLTFGKYKIQYMVEAASQYSSISFPLNVIVDRDAPAPSGPVSIADEYDNTITREDMISNGNKFPLLIPSYRLIEADDIVKLTWIGANSTAKRLPEYIITEEDVGKDFISIDVQETVIVDGGEGNAIIYYNLTDRAGNVSSRSPDHSISVIINPAAQFLTPARVPLAEQGPITDASTRAPVTALIPKYTNILPGDLITLRWRKGAITPSLTVPDPIPLNAYVLEFTIPREKIWETKSGKWELDYQVTRGRVVTTSDPNFIDVDLNIPGPEDPDKTTDVNENLSEVTVVGNGVKETNKLRPGDLRKGAIVTVPYYEKPTVDDTIRVYWGGRSSGEFIDYKVKADDINDNKTAFNIEVDAAIVDSTPENERWEVTYDLINATNDNLGLTTYVDAHLAGPGGPEGLVMPELLGRNGAGWLIEGAGVNPSTSVLIKAYENMSVGDIVTLHWIGNSKTNGKGEDIASTKFSTSVTIVNGTVNKSLQMVIPYAPYIMDIIYGSAKCYYSVEQLGYVFDSNIASVKLDLEGPAGS